MDSFEVGIFRAAGGFVQAAVAAVERCLGSVVRRGVRIHRPLPEAVGLDPEDQLEVAGYQCAVPAARLPSLLFERLSPDHDLGARRRRRFAHNVRPHVVAIDAWQRWVVVRRVAASKPKQRRVPVRDVPTGAESERIV